MIVQAGGRREEAHQESAGSLIARYGQGGRLDAAGLRQAAAAIIACIVCPPLSSIALSSCPVNCMLLPCVPCVVCYSVVFGLFLFVLVFLVFSSNFHRVFLKRSKTCPQALCGPSLFKEEAVE